MILVRANNINEIQLRLLSILRDRGEFVNSRGLEVKEIYPVMLELTNVRNRVTSLSERNWNLIFALGEFSWHLSESNRLDFINYYSKNWTTVSEDGRTIAKSCYGKKIFNSDTWNKLIFELQEDNDTRRAVISLYDDSELGLKSKDVSCTLSLQFILRNGMLDLITTMRSNDIIWGLPNDIFFFTMLQEMLSIELNVKLGNYYHQVNSLHIYKRHYDLMQKILQNPVYIDFEMPKMNSIKEISNFIELEKKIRNSDIIENVIMENYWKDLINVLKLRSSMYSVNEKHNLINNSEYKELLKLCPATYINNPVA